MYIVKRLKFMKNSSITQWNHIFHPSVDELMENTFSTNCVEFPFPQTKWNLSSINR